MTLVSRLRPVDKDLDLDLYDMELARYSISAATMICMLMTNNDTNPFIISMRLLLEHEQRLHATCRGA